MFIHPFVRKRLFIPVRRASLQQFFKNIMMFLLNRMQSSKTDKYTYLFVKFLLFIMAVEVPDGLSEDYVISVLEGIQPNLWLAILNNFVVPETSRIPVKDRKLAVVGLTRLLTKSTYMLQQPNVQAWPVLFTALVKQFNEPQYLEGPKEDSMGMTDIDQEEQTAGYQAAYSQLAASSSAPEDPVAYVQDPRKFLVERLMSMDGNQLRQLVSRSEMNVVGPFLQGTGLV